MATRKGSKRKSSAGKAKKRGGAKKSARGRAKARGGKKRKTGRKPNAAFMKPMSPSSQLSLVVGSASIPRTEVTKRLWSYIKRRGLQDSKNRRMINADDNLRPIFGGKRQVSMFEMTRLVSKHLR